MGIKADIVNIRAAYWRYKGGRRTGGSRRLELLAALWWLSYWNDWHWLRRLVSPYVTRVTTNGRAEP